MKSSASLIAIATLLLIGSSPSEAEFICTGSIVDDAPPACDGSAIFLRIGRNADGTMAIDDGSDLTVADDGIEGAFMHVGREGNNGTLTVTGSGSSATVNGGALHGQTTLDGMPDRTAM